jgi:hypothetical protein
MCMYLDEPQCVMIEDKVSRKASRVSGCRRMDLVFARKVGRIAISLSFDSLDELRSRL